jgi:PAS domain S-box-containing protein
VAQTPVIFHTAVYHQREALTLARQSGVNDVLTKPSEPEAIMAKVDAALGHPSAVTIPPAADTFDRQHRRVVADALVEKVAELEASHLRLAAVVDLCHHFASQLGPVTLLHVVCMIARDVTLARHAVVGILNDDRTDVLHAVTCGIDVGADSDRGLSLPRGPLVNPILDDRRTVRRTNPDGRPERLGLPATHPDVYSYLGVPIASPTRVYGWIGLWNKVGVDGFSDSDEQVAIVIGIHAGIAYENARLVADLQKQAGALRKIEERTNDALGGAGMGVWEIDLGTNRLMWSETMAPMFGLTPDQVPTTTEAVMALAHPDDRPMLEAAVARAARDGSDFEVEHRILWPDASTRWVAGRARVQRDESRRPVRLLGVATDITERRRIQEALVIAKDAAEAANQAKSQFLSNMSHEIRTPMNGIIGMTDLVLDTELTSEQRENLQIVKSSADSLLVMINDILDFSRIEARKLELDPIDFDPRDAINDTAHALASRAHQKGLELFVDVNPAVPHTLRGDAGRLRQVLVNVIGNAIKFTNLGEVVLCVTREASPQDVVLQFSVMDTGVGIPMDRQERVFEAFTQADGSMTRAYGGTGLGLALSSQLVQLMGGRLWVESESGRGSTFHFTARFTLAEPPAPPALVSDADLRDMRVLVVDDNSTNRRLLQEMLIGWHMIPTLVESVPAALAALRVTKASGQPPFALVLTDVQMPDMDGFGLAHAIKTDPSIVGPSVVMLTSTGQPGDGARCRELGVAAYLTKPIRRADLRGAILLAVGTHAAGRPPVLVTRHSMREARQGGRILLVEDNKVNQVVARSLLERRGHTVVVASNGREALAILDDAACPGFGCVLMDVQKPEMGGFECAAIIRDREQVTRLHLPIIAMTAHVMKGDDARCLAAGMDAYLPKPIRPDDLFAVVEHYLGVSRVPGSLPPS